MVSRHELDGDRSQPGQAVLGIPVPRRRANQPQRTPLRAQHNIYTMSDFIKKSDVAKICNVSIRTVENWTTKSGLLPYLKIRGVVRYRRQDVEDALEAFIVNPRTRNRETTN